MATESFPALLDQARIREPGRPLITAYDEATGARTELSVTTYANWVAKTANLFTEEYLLDAGDTIRLALPPHWLTPVFVGAALTTGLATTTAPDLAVDLVVCGPGGLGTFANPPTPTLACSLTAFATPFTHTLPAGVDDYGLLWPGQSDVFTPTPVPPQTTAVRAPGGSLTQGDLLAQGREWAAQWAGSRVLTDADLARAADQALLFAALLDSGSLVLVSNPTDARWPERYADERVTDVQITNAATA